MRGTFHAWSLLKVSVEYTLFAGEDQIRNQPKTSQEGRISGIRHTNEMLELSPLPQRYRVTNLIKNLYKTIILRFMTKLTCE
jgi:hypothetical protein